uniref:Uncharacterized protein n=1 Tax=Rhodopseudomonas palustris (strain ATCC BAA-98 / CGA009) TaxID=258594 RepID=Q6NA77_RHOPA|nr:hypothetical protein RPA1308 [Rhodopseudomonas palustris CGA009]
MTKRASSTSGRHCQTAAVRSATQPLSSDVCRPRPTALYVHFQAADHGGPMMFARIGVSRMVSRHHPEPPRPLRKDKPWGRRRLKRDE